jgi:aspartate carbamoyltransferase catalytic subunit
MKILRKDLLDLRSLNAGQVQSLLDLSLVALQGGLPRDALQGRVVALAFFEPSTRTCTSFELAARRLGAEVLRFDVARSSRRPWKARTW